MLKGFVGQALLAEIAGKKLAKEGTVVSEVVVLVRLADMLMGVLLLAGCREDTATPPIDAKWFGAILLKLRARSRAFLVRVLRDARWLRFIDCESKDAYSVALERTSAKPGREIICANIDVGMNRFRFN